MVLINLLDSSLFPVRSRSFLIYTMIAKKLQPWPSDTGNISATMVLTLRTDRAMENLASNMAKVIVSTQNDTDSISKQILHFVQNDKSLKRHSERSEESVSPDF